MVHGAEGIAFNSIPSAAVDGPLAICLAREDIMKLSWTNGLQNWSRIFRRKPQRRRNSHALLNGEHLESRQLMTVYAIDPVSGSDSNPGSLELPFRTPKNLSFSTSEGNPDYRTLQAGDVVYLREGVHDWSSLLTIPQTYDEQTAFMIRGVQGTEEAPVIIQAFPGERPIVTARENGVANMAIFVLQSEHIKVLGLEVTGTFGPGIRVGESSEIEIAHNYIHDIDGHHDNNIAGIYTSDTLGLHVHHNLLHDNYDRARANTPGEIQRANSRNIVIFGDNSDRVVVHHNKVFNTPRADGRETGEGIWVKHASQIPGAHFEFYDNIVRDVQFSAIGSQSPNAHMHHNLIVNAAPFLTSGGDNITVVGGNRLEYNTFAGSRAYELYGVPNLFPTEGLLHFQNNIVVDDEPFYGVDHGIIRIAPYGSDADYGMAVTPENLQFSDNVYFNAAAPPKWNLFAADQADDRQPAGLGGNLSFTEWQSLGIDQRSVVADPELGASFLPTNPIAANAGWYASDEPRLAMYVAQDLFRESAGANASSLTLVRSGMDLSQQLVVTLATSDASEVQIPQTVTFAVGVSMIQIPITSVDDNKTEPTRAVQIFAATDSGMQSSEWVRVLQDTGPVSPAGSTVEFLSTSQTVDENSRTVTFEVVRSGNLTGAINVYYETRGDTATSGRDFTAKRGRIRFTSGESTKTITVTLKDDRAIEGDELFQIRLTRVTSRATLGASAHSEVTIRDDELPYAPSVLEVIPVTTSRGLEGLTIQFDSPMDRTTVVRRASYSVRDAGSDGLFGTRDDRTLKIRGITFDDQTNSVTLMLSNPVTTAGRLLRLDIRDRSLFGENRLSLDGDHNGEPGGHFREVIAE